MLTELQRAVCHASTPPRRWQIQAQTARIASQKGTRCLARPRPASPCPSPRRQLSPLAPAAHQARGLTLQHLCGPMPGAAMAWPSSWLVSTIHFGRASAAVGRHARYFDGREERAERTREGARQPTHMPTPLQPARGAAHTGVHTAAAHRIRRLRAVDVDARCAPPSPLRLAPAARRPPARLRFVCSQVLPPSICSPAGPAAAAPCADALYSSAVLAAAPAATFLAASSLGAVGAAAVAASERDTNALCCVMCVESRFCSAGTSGFNRELD